MEKEYARMKIEDIVELANRGNAEAEYELGYRFENGLDVEQDRKEALKWFLKASRKGHADATLASAETYYWGRGVKRDKEKSQWFYLEACASFDRDYKAGRRLGYSAFRIYEILYGGHVGERHVEVADKWLRKAMDAKNPEAFCERARRYFLGEESMESDRKAAALYEEALALLAEQDADEEMISELQDAVDELKRQ